MYCLTGGRNENVKNKNAVFNDNPGNKEAIDNCIQQITICLSQIQTFYVCIAVMLAHFISRFQAFHKLQ